VSSGPTRPAGVPPRHSPPTWLFQLSLSLAIAGAALLVADLVLVLLFELGLRPPIAKHCRSALHVSSTTNRFLCVGIDVQRDRIALVDIKIDDDLARTRMS
jgi:hypothetical protein